MCTYIFGPCCKLNFVDNLYKLQQIFLVLSEEGMGPRPSCTEKMSVSTDTEKLEHH